MWNVVKSGIPYEEVQQLGNRLVQRSETIAVAESVTAGYIQAYLSSADGATSFFHGGLCVYNNAQKYKHLGVDPIMAERVNGVSEKLAAQMAMNVAKKFCSDYGCAITGYAEPDLKWLVRKPYAWLAITRGQQVLLNTKLEPLEDNFADAQQDYARQAILHLLKVIE